MASSVNGIWAIDIGSNDLKALHLEEGEGGLEVLGFDFIEHSKVLTGEGLSHEEQKEILKKSIHTFLERNDIGKTPIAVSLAGHNSFARFIKLPPVEEKRIPEIVQFEAVQQIPFEINEVEWDWQLMENPYSEETEVGLFAVKNEILNELMDHFSNENAQVSCVQIAPIALHNYVNFDRDDVGTPKEKATVIIDVGTENTTLVVCTQNSVWQRSIRIGGNAFTEAIVDKFDISFRKAEKLKRKALTSKYVRHIFSAMKPIYTDLGSEIQRSLGFYSSSGPGRDKGFSKVIAIGGGMKLKGVAKYLQQTLGIPVEKPDSFDKLTLDESLSAAKFHENASDFAIAYGLGVQVLADEPKITSNLLPKRIARSMAWAKKAKIITVAAGLLFVVSMVSMANAVLQNSKYESNDQARREVEQIIGQARQAESNYNEQAQREKGTRQRIAKQISYLQNRELMTDMVQVLLKCLPNEENAATEEEKEIHRAFEEGNIKKIMSLPRKERKMMFITAFTVDYSPMISEAKFRELGKNKAQGTRVIRSMEVMDDMMMMEGMMGPGMMEGYGDMGMGGEGMGVYGGYGTTEEEEKTNNDGPGFIVTIEGYSPYKNIGALLDPPHANKKEDWGIITRFENLSKIIGKNCPFELFDEKDKDNFRVEFGDVEPGNSNMPLGIGEQLNVVRVEEPEKDNRNRPARYNYNQIGRSTDRITEEIVLIDPMTKEEMSKTYDYYTAKDIEQDPSMDPADIGVIKKDLNGEPKYIERDRWFRVNLKFVWKGSPDYKPPKKNTEQNPNGMGPGGMPGGMPGDMGR